MGYLKGITSWIIGIAVVFAFVGFIVGKLVYHDEKAKAKGKPVDMKKVYKKTAVITSIVVGVVVVLTLFSLARARARARNSSSWLK